MILFLRWDTKEDLVFPYNESQWGPMLAKMDLEVSKLFGFFLFCK